MVQVVSISAGRTEPSADRHEPSRRGIRKSPVGRGHVHALGLAGDVVADVENHGGLDQALYLYSSDDYAFWADELGGVPAPGTFGENLPPLELRLRAGSDRRPLPGRRCARRGDGAADSCAVFATRMGEADWVQRFAGRARPGLYVRVPEPGEVAAGDPVERSAEARAIPPSST